MPEERILPDYDQSEKTFQLHKEELKISKKLMETADVKIYKKTFTQEKQVLIPVTREELIIEKRTVNSITEDEQIETIRIPLSEEKIKIILEPQMLEKIEIYKRQYKELIQIHESLKREKIRVKTFGNINVVEEPPPPSYQNH